MSKGVKIFVVLCVLLCLALCAPAYAEQPVTVLLDGGKISFDTQPRIVNDRVTVPMRAIFEAYGALIYWDESEKSVTSKYGDTEIYLKIDDPEMTVGDETVELDSPPYIFEDRTYVPVRAVSEAFGSGVAWDPDERVVSIISPPERNGILDDMAVSDEFRYADNDGEYNGVSIFDNDNDYFGMELLAISPWRGEQYAEIVNGMAEDLPDVRVFCGVVPTAGEFYASDTYRTNYKPAIAHIYNNLSDRVTPLNLEGAMNINLGHYLYFRTDHHWTHFGAYCAYLEFCDRAGITPPPLDDFDTTVINGYIGSWGRATEGTDGYDLLSSTPDKMVLYEPNVDYSGSAYYDMEFERPIMDVELLNENFRDYNVFIEGDMPVVHFHTSVGNGRSVCLIKESYGNAFSTWLVNSYEDVYVVDYRQFNGHDGNDEPFEIKDFYELHPFDDLLVLSYPYTVLADDLREMFGQMRRSDYVNPPHITDYVPGAGGADDGPLPTLVPQDVISGDFADEL